MQAEFEKFLFQAKKPTAIFAVNDYLALEMLQAAHRAGIKVPEELALIGFDDTTFSSHLNPPLTTVSQPLLDLGFRAGDLIINRINGQVGSYKHLVLPTNLVIREFLRVEAANLEEPGFLSKTPVRVLLQKEDSLVD